VSIFTLAKPKIIPGFKINMHLWKTQAVNWWSRNLSRQNQSELFCKLVPISQGHAFTETRFKQTGFETQRYWVFGLCQLSGFFLNNNEKTHNVQWLRLALSKGPNRVGVFPHLRTETDPVSETLYVFFIVI
jgi:hypothetical protein